MKTNKPVETKRTFEERFLTAYKEAKRLNFLDYCIGSHNNVLVTWKDVKTMLDFKIRIPKKQRENIELNLDIFFKSQENLKLFMKVNKETAR